MQKDDAERDAMLAVAGFRLVSASRELVVVADLKTDVEYRASPAYGILAWDEIVPFLKLYRDDLASLEARRNAAVTQAIQRAADRH